MGHRQLGRLANLERQPLVRMLDHGEVLHRAGVDAAVHLASGEVRAECLPAGEALVRWPATVLVRCRAEIECHHGLLVSPGTVPDVLRSPGNQNLLAVSSCQKVAASRS